MSIKFPQDNHRYVWTLHSKGKLVQYALTPNTVKKVIRNPERVEEGIAPNTVAMMKRKDTKTQKRETWVMYQQIGSRKRIISAWIYPGVSPKGKEIYIPDDVLMELERIKEESMKRQRAGKHF